MTREGLQKSRNDFSRIHREIRIHMHDIIAFRNLKALPKGVTSAPVRSVVDRLNVPMAVRELLDLPARSVSAAVIAKHDFEVPAASMHRRAEDIYAAVDNFRFVITRNDNGNCGHLDYGFALASFLSVSATR